MVGSRVSVWLNEKLVVDHAILENYYDKARKLPIPARGPIELQTHGGEIRWRNVYIREIGSAEANKILASKGETPGFKSIFNGKDFTGWNGESDIWEIQDGTIFNDNSKHSGQHHVHYVGGPGLPGPILGDFDLKLEFKATTGEIGRAHV